MSEEFDRTWEANRKKIIYQSFCAALAIQNYVGATVLRDIYIEGGDIENLDVGDSLLRLVEIDCEKK